MIESVHQNSLDEDTKRFVPDEVFETIEKAAGVVRFLMGQYDGSGPFVYPLITLDGGENIGYVQAVPIDGGQWEIGYKIASRHAGQGYATEALSAFLPIIMGWLEITEIWGISRADNGASCRVMEKLGFELKEQTVANYHGAQHQISKYLFSLPS
ncbi:MAG: GNAT family N-acetyltransferase [Defluviitaleaceae bacterium]|nr:GNAT family N-acetyltransferase [Defluviitaleaceae bacterium]